MFITWLSIYTSIIMIITVYTLFSQDEGEDNNCLSMFIEYFICVIPIFFILLFALAYAGVITLKYKITYMFRKPCHFVDDVLCPYHKKRKPECAECGVKKLNDALNKACYDALIKDEGK